MQIEKSIHHKLCDQCKTAPTIEIDFYRQAIDAGDGDAYQADSRIAMRADDNHYTGVVWRMVDGK